MFSIIVVFPKQEDADHIRSILVRNGFDVHAACTTGAQAVGIANELDEGIVISGYRMPDMLFREINNCLPKGFEMLLVASEARLVEVCGENIMAVGMPLKTRDLIGTIHVMTQKLTQGRRRGHAKPKARTEEEKSVVEKAKLILMQRNHMSEEEAHRYLQKSSMDSGVNLVEMAEMVIRML